MTKIRLDMALVARGLLPSRSRARDAILRGKVAVDGDTVRKPGHLVHDAAPVSLTEPASPYVSRAAEKLVHALEHFAIDPSGAEALDIGASTGGFTQVLLERGARHVTAIDVGHGQLHASVAEDPRVTAIEGLNARDLMPRHLPAPPNLVVCDASFISLTLALPPALALAAPMAVLIALVKPQFEVGREKLGKGGIVRDEDARERVCERIVAWIGTQAGWAVTGTTASPLEGADGNREYLLAARKNGS